MMTTLRVALACLCAAAAPALLGGQAARPRVDPLTASIGGTVTAAGSGAPVAGAEVRVASDGSVYRLATTDGSGRYEVRALPAGRYRVTASRAGFTSLQFGQRQSFEAPIVIDLQEGERETGDIALPRGGAVFGRVSDEYGDPVTGALVVALRARTLQGRRQLQRVGVGDQTDDLGAFRLYGLPPGDYYVAAQTGEVDAVRRDPPIYYPGTVNPGEALPVPVGSGTEAPVSIQVAPVALARVSGVVIDSSGAPVEAMVSLTSDLVSVGPRIDGSGPPALRLMGDSGPDGRFTIADVPPGQYVLTAVAQRLPSLPTSPDEIQRLLVERRRSRSAREIQLEMARTLPESASMPLAVAGGSVEGLTLATRAATAIRGTLVVDSGVTERVPAAVGVRLVSSHVAGFAMSRSMDGGEFLLGTSNEPVHLEATGLPDGWGVRAMLVDGADVTDSLIQPTGQEIFVRVVLTNRVTGVTGTVRSRADVGGRTVVVFAADPDRWTYPTRYVRTARTDADGRFRILALPPDERYRAVALEYLEEGETEDPEFLNRLSRDSVTFSLGESERRSIELDLQER